VEEVPHFYFRAPPTTCCAIIMMCLVFATHMKKAVMLFKGSKGAQFLFTAKYQNN